MELLLKLLIFGIVLVVVIILFKRYMPIDIKTNNLTSAPDYNPTKNNSGNPSAKLYEPDEKLVDFAKTQLIGGVRFLESYDFELKALHNNAAFMKEILQLRAKYNACEITDTREINRDIADYFYYNKLNERYLQVNSITQKVKQYGKQASAHISIYYAMFLYD